MTATDRPRLAQATALSTNSFTHVGILDPKTPMGPKGKHNRRNVLPTPRHCLRCLSAGAGWGENAFNLQARNEESKSLTQGGHLVRCQKTPFTGPSQSARTWPDCSPGAADLSVWLHSDVRLSLLMPDPGAFLRGDHGNCCLIPVALP